MTVPFPPDVPWTAATTAADTGDTDLVEDADMAAWQAAEPGPADE